MRTIDTEAVLLAHLNHILSDKVTVVYVPIQVDSYGEWAIKIEPDRNPYDMYQPTPITMGVTTTQIKLEKFAHGRGAVYAGYDDTTQTLVIGKENW